MDQFPKFECQSTPPPHLRNDIFQSECWWHPDWHPPPLPSLSTYKVSADWHPPPLTLPQHCQKWSIPKSLQILPSLPPHLQSWVLINPPLTPPPLPFHLGDQLPKWVWIDPWSDPLPSLPTYKVECQSTPNQPPLPPRSPKKWQSFQSACQSTPNFQPWVSINPQLTPPPLPPSPPKKWQLPSWVSIDWHPPPLPSLPT